MGFFTKFFYSQEKEELAVVFDIASSSVGGAIFHMSKSGVPKIIFSVREPIVLLEQMDIDQFLSLTMKSLSVVAGKISKLGIGSPSRIFCVLSSLWYASQTRVVKLSKNTPFVFNSKLADSLIQQEIKLFEEEHLKNYAASPGNKVLPIELKNMKTVLNGYPTPKPLNQKAKELEMTIFISMSGQQFLEKVQEVMVANFHRTDVKFSSFAMASFAVARDMFAKEENFVLVDIGGEVTDISMVKKDILTSSVSFPLARNFMVRGIASSLHCSLDEAESLISLYKDGHAEDATKQRIQPIMVDLQSAWLKRFQECLANLSSDIAIPSTIFITVEQDLAEFFSTIIKNEEFSQYSLTESKFKIIFLGNETLHGGAMLEKDAVRDPFIILESIYINRYLR